MTKQDHCKLKLGRILNLTKCLSCFIMKGPNCIRQLAEMWKKTNNNFNIYLFWYLSYNPFQILFTADGARSENKNTVHYLSSAKQEENDSGYLVVKRLAAQGIFPPGLTTTQAESVYWTSAGGAEQDFKATPLLLCASTEGVNGQSLTAISFPTWHLLTYPKQRMYDVYTHIYVCIFNMNFCTNSLLFKITDKPFFFLRYAW